MACVREGGGCFNAAASCVGIGLYSSYLGGVSIDTSNKAKARY